MWVLCVREQESQNKCFERFRGWAFSKHAQISFCIVFTEIEQEKNILALIMVSEWLVFSEIDWLGTYVNLCECGNMYVSRLGTVTVCMVHNTICRHFPYFPLKMPLNSV